VRKAADEIGIRDDAEQARAYQEADKYFPDDCRLIDPGGKEIARKCNEKQEGHLEFDKVKDFAQGLAASLSQRVLQNDHAYRRTESM
jgi:hypothetical protein